MNLELKNINRNNLADIADFFSKNHSTTELLKSFTITQDNGYGTLFIESSLDDSIKLAIHKNIPNGDTFSSITFFRTSISIAELIDLYPVYHMKYVPHDNEYCYNFKSISQAYIINAFTNDDGFEQKDVNELKTRRLTIRW